MVRPSLEAATTKLPCMPPGIAVRLKLGAVAAPTEAIEKLSPRDDLSDSAGAMEAVPAASVLLPMELIRPEDMAGAGDRVPLLGLGLPFWEELLGLPYSVLGLPCELPSCGLPLEIRGQPWSGLPLHPLPALPDLDTPPVGGGAMMAPSPWRLPPLLPLPEPRGPLPRRTVAGGAPSACTSQLTPSAPQA